MTPIRLRYLGEECHDAIVEHFFRTCPVALCREDAEAFFGTLCLIIDREIARVVSEFPIVSPSPRSRRTRGHADAASGNTQGNARNT